jgi:hypothetical protein
MANPDIEEVATISEETDRPAPKPKPKLTTKAHSFTPGSEEEVHLSPHITAGGRAVVAALGTTLGWFESHFKIMNKTSTVSPTAVRL